MSEQETIRRMVDKAGAWAHLKPPYVINAVYRQEDDRSIVFVVFTDADGKQSRTGRFKLLPESHEKEEGKESQ